MAHPFYPNLLRFMMFPTIPRQDSRFSPRPSLSCSPQWRAPHSTASLFFHQAPISAMREKFRRMPPGPDCVFLSFSQQNKCIIASFRPPGSKLRQIAEGKPKSRLFIILTNYLAETKAACTVAVLVKYYKSSTRREPVRSQSQASARLCCLGSNV